MTTPFLTSEAAQEQLSSDRQTLIYFLAAATGLLLCFDDLAIVNLGGLTTSPAWVPLCGVYFLMRTRETPGDRYIRSGTYLIAYATVLSIATLPFIPAEIIGENAAAKVVKLVALTGAWLISFAAGVKLAVHLPNALTLIGVVATVGLLLGASASLIFNQVDQLSIFHSTPNTQQRVRGFRFEASSLGGGLLVCGALALAGGRSRRAGLQYALLLLLTLALTQSRGTLIAIVLLALVCIWAIAADRTTASTPDQTNQLTLGLATLFAALTLAFALSYLLTLPQWGSLREDGSDATRAAWSSFSVLTLLHYPLGQGFAGFLRWAPQLLEQSLHFISPNYKIEDMQEAASLASTDNDRALSPKSLYGLFAMYFGIPGLALLAGLTVRVGSLLGPLRSAHGGQIVAVAALVVVASSYFSSPTSWEQPLLLGALASIAATRRAWTI